MKCIYVVLISLVLSIQYYSQTDSSKSNYALSFGISNNFTLSNFNMDIAAKKVLDNTNQIRLFLSPRLSLYNSEEERRENTEMTENESTRYSIGIGVDYIWLLSSIDNFNMYSGTGLVAHYGIDKSEKRLTYSDGNKGLEERSKPYTNLGIRGIIGVEWKVSQRIGIHSEYLLTLSHTWRSSESDFSYNGVNNTHLTSTTSSILLVSQVLFGVSVYL